MKCLTDSIKDSFGPHNKISFALNEYKNVLLDYFGEFDKVEFVNAFDLSKILPEKILDDVNKNVSLFPIFGCVLSHYTCVKSAKLFGYKKILILEDDMCFLKNKETLELFFNNLPDDWDYIKYMYVWYFNTIKLNENILYYFLAIFLNKK